MIKRFTRTKALTLIAFAVAAIVALGIYGSRVEPVRASNQPRLRPLNFGAFSLSAGQTARLNVVNAVLVQPEDATVPAGDANRPAESFRVTLAFDVFVPAVQTDDGSRLVTEYRFLRRESHEATLRPGEAVSLNFTAPDGTLVNAVVLGPPDAKGANKMEGPEESHIRATLEVREGGSTVFMHPGSARGMFVNGQPQGQ